MEELHKAILQWGISMEKKNMNWNADSQQST